jgi:hypothetical protein
MKKWIACSIGIVVILLMILSAGTQAFGGEAVPSGVMSLIVENDLFYNQDNNYTSGAALAWVSGEGSTAIFLRSLIALTSTILHSSLFCSVNIERKPV